MKLNLVHVTLGMGIGGLEQCICHLAAGLDRDRFRLTVGCLDHGGDLLEMLQETDHFLESRKPGLDLGLIFRLAARFRRNNVHIVHAHNQAAHFYAGMAARLARVPVLVCTEHSRHHIHGVRRRIMEKQLLYRITDRWIEVSRELHEASVEQDRLLPGKLVVVPNGIPIPTGISEGEKQRARAGIGLSLTDRMILMAARLDPVKNHALMLETLALIQKDPPGTFLVLAGEGEMKESLARQAQDLDIGDRVLFLGNRRDVPTLMAASDLFVLCSRSEGLPLSLLEAAAARVPILVTTGANRAGFIEHGVTGIVADPDPRSMAGEIRNLLDSSPDHGRMTSRARQKAVSDFSAAAMTDQYEMIYLDLARAKGVIKD